MHCAAPAQFIFIINMGSASSTVASSPEFSHRSSLRECVASCLFALVSLFVLIGAHPSSASAQARRNNLGKNFYVAFGANEGGNEGENLMALYITSHTTAKGVVSVPAINFTQSFTTTPGAITTIVLPSDLSTTSVEIRLSEVVLPGMAVHITADTDVAVYGMNHKLYSSDAFMALPVNVLGTEYRTMNFPSSGGAGSETPGENLIVGVQDSTHVTITPAAATFAGRPAMTPFTITLNAGEVYMVQGDPLDGTNDQTGSHIESDQPIAVFSGHMRTQIPENGTNANGNVSRDHLIEQMPPVSAWGDSALVVPYATSVKPDLVRIVSAEDGNVITVNGTVVATLNAGQFYQITSLPGVTSIIATNPIAVGQYMHTSWGTLNDRRNPAYGDPALALIFPVEQFDTAYTILSIVNSAAFVGNYVNLVVDKSGVGSLTLDGVVIAASNFKPIPNSSYVYAQIALQQGTHNLRCAKPFGTTVYALGNVDSYAYTGGTQIKTITPLKTVDQVIDFGDRLLKPDLSGAFDSIVPLTNISSDPVDIFGFPRHLQDTTKFYVTNPVASQALPVVVAPGQSSSMTIEFNPKELNRRMHTQIIAKTVHLRAYVVDVYGRGVIDHPEAYSDKGAGHSIDTVDFGLFASTDPPKDTTIFIGNTGSARTEIASLGITGNDQTYFLALNRLLPFAVDTGAGKSDSITLRFTPAAPNGIKVANLLVSSKNGVTKQVVLIARIETVSVASLSTPAFDTILTCQTEDRTITLTNPNDVAVHIDSIVVSGPNAAEFIVTANNISIAPNGSANVPVRFAPGADGARNATLTVYFSIPKGSSKSISLTGTSSHAGMQFNASQAIHILGGENFELTIWAASNLTPYKANGYTLQLNYDSTNLSFTDVDQNNTHSYFGYPTLSGIPGHELVTYQCVTDSLLWGGGTSDSIPLIKLKFNSTLNGADLTTFTSVVHIGFDVELANAVVAGTCLQSLSSGAIVTLDSTCSTVHLVDAWELPLQVFMAQNNPNPFNPSTVIQYEVPVDCQARILIQDVLGRPVAVALDEWKKAGRYSLRFDAGSLSSGVYYGSLHANGVVRTKRMVLAR
jgi:hypothetical protein